MAEVNLNNFEYALQANMTAVQTTIDLANEAGLRLQAEAFDNTDTVRLTLDNVTRREVIVVSAQTQDGGGTGICRVTIDTRAAEVVENAAATAYAFNASNTDVFSALTADQIAALRAGGGGGGAAAFPLFESASGSQDIAIDDNPMIVHTSGFTATTVNLTVPATVSKAYRAVFYVPAQGNSANYTITVNGGGFDTVFSGSIPFNFEFEDHRVEVDVWRDAGGTLYSSAIVHTL